MAGRDGANGNKHSRSAKGGRRLLFGVGAGAGVFLAAAAMATGSAAPAKADFEDLLDPIIQPLLTSVTDAISGVDPAAATDLTSWTDSLLSSLNSIDLAVPSAESAAATASSAEPAAVQGTYDIPITIAENTEPTVQATVDGANTTDLVDTGSSGLVIPETDLSATQLTDLGIPNSFGESGYSGGVDYIYLTYDNATVDYGGSGLDTTAPVEVEVYSWDPSDLSSLFTNDAFQNFLSDNDVTGILGIGDDTSGGAGESPIEAAGFTGVTVDLPQNYLVVSDSNPGTAYAELPSGGSTPTSDLTETVTDGNGVVGTGSVSDDLDSGGVYGTIPESITGSSDTVPDGDMVTVSDDGTPLYSYIVENDGANGLPNESPTAVTGDDIDSGYQAFENNPVYIDYASDTLSYDDLLPADEL